MKDRPNIRSCDISFNEEENLSSRILLSRTPHPTYLQEWEETLRNEEITNKKTETISVLIFRLGQEWFALQTVCFKEITEKKTIHHLPHKTNSTLLGVVNLNGELQPCISLHTLLEIDLAFIRSNQHLYQKDRMVAVMQEKKLWVFPVDEIDGIYIWDCTLIENIPINVSKSKINYLKGIVNHKNRHIGILEEELLFYSFNRIFS